MRYRYSDFLIIRWNMTERSLKKKQKIITNNPKDAGYSLLEILVVLAIIGTLMALVAPRLLGNVDKSKVIAAKAQARTLKLALDSFRLDMGRYPDGTEGLSVLVTAPSEGEVNWFGPYLEGDVPPDPWGNPFIYQAPEQSDRSQSPKVLSLGSDNKVGGTGLNADISG